MRYVHRSAIVTNTSDQKLLDAIGPAELNRLRFNKELQQRRLLR